MMDDDEASNIHHIHQLQAFQKKKTAGSIAKSSLTMHQALRTVTQSTLDVIGKNQVKFAKYMKLPDYEHTIIRQGMDIEVACVEGEITNVFS